MLLGAVLIPSYGHGADRAEERFQTKLCYIRRDHWMGLVHAPAVLSNADLSTFLDTNDEWITSRTGMRRERRISHVAAVELSTIASARALACAGSLRPTWT